MKIKNQSEFTRPGEREVIARFGDATLLKTPDGKWQLRGGRREDRQEAQEWISFFLHEATVAVD